jgi:hypothetical protein
VLRQRCPIRPIGLGAGAGDAALCYVRAPEDAVRKSGRPTEWSHRRRPRPHQANCELDPTLLSPIVEPQNEARIGEWSLPSPLASAQLSPVSSVLGYTAIVQRAEALRDAGVIALAHRSASY